MLGRIFHTLLGALLFVSMAACGARVIRQTATTAIIQGKGATKVEARLQAEEKATELFGTFEIEGEPDCSQEYHSSANVDPNTGAAHASGRTFWSCVVNFRKK